MSHAITMHRECEIGEHTDSKMIMYMKESGKARWLLELGLDLGLGRLVCSGPCLPWAFTQIPFLH